MDHLDLEADCSRCVGLCCIALRLDRADGFGHDKLAGDACHHLDQNFRCRIHDRLEDLGYEGCDAFDCLGAGQRVTASFASLNWQRDRIPPAGAVCPDLLNGFKHMPYVIR